MNSVHSLHVRVFTNAYKIILTNWTHEYNTNRNYIIAVEHPHVGSE